MATPPPAPVPPPEPDRPAPPTQAGEAPTLLAGASAGDRQAVERLLPLVYDELRAVARNLIRDDRPGHTLQPTALVNEAAIRLLGARSLSFNDRAHFFAIAARAMRQVLASHARARNADKRRAPGHRLTLMDVADAGPPIDHLALDEALTQLAQLDERHARLIELRFYAGLSIEDAAHVLGVSVRSLNRDWRIARAWLTARLGEAAAPTDDPPAQDAP